MQLILGVDLRYLPSTKLPSLILFTWYEHLYSIRNLSLIKDVYYTTRLLYTPAEVKILMINSIKPYYHAPLPFSSKTF
jgi:hypothetical protein